MCRNTTIRGYNNNDSLTHINGVQVHQYDNNGNLEYDETKKYVWDAAVGSKSDALQSLKGLPDDVAAN